MKSIATNRNAFRDYQILEKLEAGIELKGHEVRSIKTGHINLAGSFVTIKENQAWLINADVPPYQPANMPADYDPKRARRLLLSASEIKNLIGKTREKSLTLVPISVYNRGKLIKVEIGLAKGKKKSDKRELIKKHDIEREIDRKLKN